MKRIHLDCEVEDIALLLGFLSKQRISEPYSRYQLESIIALGEQFHFLHMADLIRPRAYGCIGGEETWGIIVFANKHQFHDLLKLAIDVLHHHDLEDGIDDMSVGSLRKLPLQYGIAILIALSTREGSSEICDEEQWRKISEFFEIKHD